MRKKSESRVVEYVVCAAVLAACGSSGGFVPDAGGPGPVLDAATRDGTALDAHTNDVAVLPRPDAESLDAAKLDATKPDAPEPHDSATNDAPVVEAGNIEAASDAPVTVHDSGSTVCIAGLNEDKDMDGWTIAEGDCNDCDPNVNPGAVDVPQTVGPDGGLSPAVDSDCDGKYDPPVPCDTGLALNDLTANDGAKSIELCQFTTESPPLPQKIWGVISAAYVRANGAAFANPGLQVGIENAWGSNVAVQAGQNMLSLSSGHARTATQSGACGSESCEENANGTAPTGFPQDNPSCPPSADINDDVALEVTIRAPTNATGYKFALKFYSMEYPYWVCDSYNDQFIALVSPAPAGSINGNIAFDSMHNPVSVNLGFFNVCDPTQKGDFAFDCIQSSGTCPTPPSPYCPLGTAQLAGTGFDTWDSEFGGAGATAWLTTQAPVTPGKDVTIRFAIWDTGDQNFDSTVLIDDFQWIATPGVTVSTNGR